jgi:predicted dehydrogenase
MYRIAVVGCGRIAPAHLNGLKLLSNRAKAVAICDINEALRSERQENYGISRGFRTVEELLEWGEFDIAAILTPPDVRAEVCLPILKAKKHVMVEKPFNHSLDEARLIVETAEKVGVILAVNQNFRWIPPAPRLRERIIEGALGRILSVTLMDTVWRDESRGWRNTTDKLALSVMGVHWLDRIRWITGHEPKSVYTSSLNSGILTSEGEDVTSTVIKFRSGAVATLVHHWASHSRGFNNSIQVDGTEGAVLSRDNKLIWIDKENQHTVESIKRGDMPEYMAASWTELLNAADEGRQPHHSGRDNLWTVALLEGTYLSTAQNMVVETNVN